MIYNFFIRKPMKYNYLISRILDIVNLFFLIYFIFLNMTEKTFFIIALIVYFIIMVIDRFLEKENVNTDLGNLNSQITKIANTISPKSIFKIIFCIIRYLMLFFILRTSILTMMGEEWLYNTWNGIFIDNFIFIVLTILLFTRIFSYLSNISPYLLFLVIALPLFLFSIVGIETSFLNWTFISLILVSVLLQILDEDIQYLVPQKMRPQTEPSNDKLKERFFKMKFNVLLFLPLLYFSLLLSEKITNSNLFLYFVNISTSSNIEVGNTIYLSSFTVYSALVKLLIVFFSFIILFEYKESLINMICRFLLPIVNEDVFLNQDGRYFKIRNKKKFSIDKKIYYYRYKNMFIKNIPTEIEYYRLSNNVLIDKLGHTQNFKIISDHILKIDKDYFILDHSSTLNDFYITKKNERLRKLKRPDHSVWFIFLALLMIVSLLNIFLSSEMETHGRGEYKIIKEKTEPSSADENEIIYLEKNQLRIGNNKYSYDAISLTVRDNSNTKVGELKDKLLTIEIDGKKQKYLFDDSKNSGS